MRPSQDTIHKLKRVISLILESTPEPLYKTQLVKLVYLVDFLFSRQHGKTLTGLDYIWDQYGPNAKNNQIIKTADTFCKIAETMTVFGDSAKRYSLKQAEKITLSASEELFIKEVAKQFGSWTVEKITGFTKQTDPFKGKVKQFDALDFKKNANYAEIEKFVLGSQGKGLEEASETVERIHKELEKTIRADKLFATIKH